MFLGLKVLFQTDAFLLTGIWLGEHVMRILYLHLTLLSFGSAALIAAIYPVYEHLTKWFYIAGAAAVLVILGMFSGYWPKALLPDNLVYWLVVAALMPIGPTIWLLFRKV